MTAKGNFHEDFSRENEIKPGSARSFGLILAAVFAIIGLLPLWNGGTAHAWALIVTGIAFTAALLCPRLLEPLNRAWLRFGMILHKVTTPLVLGLVFVVTVVPTGLLMRLLGKNPLRLRFDPGAGSYWIRHDPMHADPKTMRQQF